MPAPNEHIAKIAALPRGINICVFSPPLLALIKCWKQQLRQYATTLVASGDSTKRKRLNVNANNRSE